MLLELQVNQFRNVDRARLMPGSGFNVIVGANGSGKSSLLEAIHVLGLGRSFRALQLERAIEHDKDGFTLFARCRSEGGREVPLGLGRKRGEATVCRLAGENLERQSDLAALLPMQLITPESFQLLTQGPKLRRQYIDWGVFHAETAFLPAWSRYRRILRQRNALLKQVRRYPELQVWDMELVRQGEILAELRENYLDALRPRLVALAGRFLPEFELTFSIGRGWKSQADLGELLANQFERERKLGYTSMGPHKADLKIRVDGLPVQEVLSRGQLKLLVCALRIAQGQHYATLSGRPCLFLIDDLPSELDSDRRALLLSALAEAGTQVFITGIEAEAILARLPDGMDVTLFQVEQGQVTERG